MLRAAFACAVLLSGPLRVGAQDASRPAEEGPEPDVTASSKIEAFTAAPGHAILIGYTRVGTVKGLYDTILTVESREHIDTATGRRCYGLALVVEVSAPGSPTYRHSTIYVDLDEMDPLMKGLDQIARLDRRRTAMDNCRAEYRTKGGLFVGTLEADVGGHTVMVVGRDQPGYPRAGLSAEGAYELSRLVVDARAKVDAARRAAGEPPPAKPSRGPTGGTPAARRGGGRG